jgi:hypothetical protein
VYSSANIIRIIKLRGMRWTEYVARMSETRNTCSVLVGKPEDLDVRERIILNWILEKQDGLVWIGFIWLRTGTSGGI